MARDKVDDLYDNLKEDGWVENSREHFRAYFLAPGEQGYKNRKALYDNMKEDGYVDSPTYEEFARRMGLHAVQPEKAQTQEPTPMQNDFLTGSLRASVHRTLADVNRTLADTDAAKERIKNMEAYHRRGGGLMRTPVKGAMRVNPKTFKVEQTYLTPTGLSTSDRQTAEQETREYNAYVDNMTVAGQMRQARAHIADLERQLDERGRQLLDEHYKNIGQQPWHVRMLRSLGEATAADRMGGSMSESPEDNVDFMNDPAYNALSLSLRQSQERLQLLENVQDKKENGDGFWRGFGRGARQAIADVNAWDFGKRDLRNASSMLNIAGKMDKGEELTPEEQTAMEDLYLTQAVMSQFGDLGAGYRWGNIVGKAPSFMKDFILTGGFSSVSSFGIKGLTWMGKKAGIKFATDVAKRAAERGLMQFVKKEGLAGIGALVKEQALPWTIKALGTTADDLLVRAPLMANTIQGQGTIAKIIENRLGNVEYDPETDGYKFAQDKSWSNAVWETEADQAIENFSEMWGEHLPGFTNVTKAFGARNLTAALLRSTREGAGTVLSKTSDFLRRAGVNGYFGEVGEEYYGQLWRTMLDLESAKDENGQNLFKSGKFHGDIWGGMALSIGLTGGGAMSANSALRYTGKAANYLAVRHRVNRSDARASEMLSPEVWDAMRLVIDATDNAGMGALAGQVWSDNGMTDEQKSAVLDYMESSMVMRGNNLREFVEQPSGPQQEEAQDEMEELEDSILDGYNATDPQEMNDAKRVLELRRQHLASSLSEDAVGDFDADPVGALSRIADPELRHIASDYVNARMVYDSMIQRVRDDIDVRIARSDAMIDCRVNRETGMIHPATMKIDDRQVYVVSGTVVMYDDGTGVDAGRSSKSVIIRDAATGKIEFSDPTQILRADESIDAEAEKEAAREQIRQETAQAAAAHIDGVLSFTPGDTYSILDADAQPTEVSLLRQSVDENGQPVTGSVDIQYPDGRIESVETSYLQQQADAANAQRIALFDKERMAQSNPNDGNMDAENISTPSVVPQNEAQSVEPTPLQRIPRDKKGEPIFEQAESPEMAWDALVEFSEGDAATAKEIADTMAEEKRKAYEKAQKLKLKGKTPSEILASKKANSDELAKAEREYTYWQKMSNVEQRRQEAIRAQQEADARRLAAERAEAEKAEREAKEEAARLEREALNGVPDMVDDTPQDARARGYRRVSGHKIDRQEPVQGLQGKEVSVRFSDDAIANGRVAVIEAEQLQPSHVQGVRNPLHFIDEAQPKERNDEASMLSARKIAGNIRPEEITSSVTAYTGAPTVNARGEAIQGNNRSDALRLMWESHQDQAAQYKQYLIDHADEFGLNADDVAAMERPVLVNKLDVEDAEAITLGQYVAQDTESGGIERIKPKNALQKMGNDIRSFANLLLMSADEETSFAGLVDKNGVDVIKWMSQRGYITPTQYKSAFDSKGNLTAEAKNDLRGIMYQSIFKGGSTRLEEMFNAMPAKAQKAILATAFRDYDSPSTERMIEEIQNSIRAFYALSQSDYFVNAKTFKDARLAVEDWKIQYQIDDATGESYLPTENFSNFALLLATMYKGENQSIIQGTFNKLYDLIQGTQEPNLFEQPDNTPRTLAQAIKETLNIIYDGQQRSNVLVGDSSASQRGQQGSTGNAATGERVESGYEQDDNSAGTQNDSGQLRNDEERKDTLSEVIEISSAERTEMETRIVDWLSEDNLSRAAGKTREEIFDEFGNELMPIAYIPTQFISLVSPTLKDQRIYCGKGYFIDHALRNHAGAGVQVSIDDVDVSKYLNIQTVLDNPDHIKETYVDGKRTVVFIKKIGRFFAELTQVEENGKVVLHKSFFNQKKEPYAKLNDIRQEDTSSEGGTSSISHTAETAPAISLQSRGDVMSNDDNSSVSEGKDTTISPTTNELGEKSAVPSVGEQVQEAEAEVNTEPTPAQAEAGNYKKGHLKIDGFDVSIENPKGSVRRGTDASGKQWEQTMNNTYGYLRGTEGVDGDHIDVFLSDDPSQGDVFVVDQVNKDGTFDEHKVMYGFADEESARQAYLSNYEKGWTGLGAITHVSKEEFKKWVQSSHRKTKPFAEYKGVKTKQDVSPTSETSLPVHKDFAKYMNNESGTIAMVAGDGERGYVVRYYQDEADANAGLAIGEVMMTPQELKTKLDSGNLTPVDATHLSKNDNQGNPLNEDGTLKLEKITSIDELTDEDFSAPTRNVELPTLPKNVDAAIGANGKPVVIKKNIFEKNKRNHSGLTPSECRNILYDALYLTNLYGRTQPKSRPNYWVAIRTSDRNKLVVLEVSEKKDNVEIVGWRFAGERQLEELRKQAEREDGQLLILTSSKEAAAGLSTLPSGVSSYKDTQISDNKEENVEKVEDYVSMAERRVIEDEAQRVASHFPMETREEAAAFDRRVPEMSDMELLAYMKADANGDVNKAHHPNVYDEYDYRHGDEIVDAYDRYLQQLQDSNTPLEQAEEMLGNIRKNLSKLATEERAELLGQEEALEDYIAELENRQTPYRSNSARQQKGTPNAVSSQEVALRDALVERLRESGVNVVTDVEEAQRVLDEANGNVRLQARLDGLKKASDFILSFLKGGTIQRSSKVEIPERANRLAEKAIGHKINSHTINANELTHAKKRHGINGSANTENSIPLRDEDFALMPYIMSAPTRVVKGSMSSNGTESVRYEKDLYNGVVIVVEREGRFDVSDMENITMWAQKKSATNVTVAQRASHSTSETIVISETDAAKIRKDAEDAIRNDEKLREQKVNGNADVEARDREYLEAVERGDKAKAQQMVEEVAKTAGYETGSSYQGTSAFNGAAPWGNGYYPTKEERISAWELGDFEGESSLGDYIDNGIDGGNIEVLTNAASYRSSDNMRREAIENIRKVVESKSGTITMYRSVPSDVKEGSFRNGDWVTPSLSYAIENAQIHGWGDNFRIIKQEVPIDDIWFDGNDIAEWGYGREENFVNDTDFAYKNTQNNRKLLDAVTYDDNGNVIPLSERFNEGKPDIRFFRTADGHAYGFVKDGKIYVDTRIAGADTPIHEYSHLWAEAFRQKNPEEWRNVVELMKGTSLWEEVKKNYPELRSDDEVADEVLAQYSGRRGAERLRAEQKRVLDGDGDVIDKAEVVSAIERVKEALKRFWRGVAEWFNVKFTTAEEVADKVLADMLGGVNPAIDGKSNELRYEANSEEAEIIARAKADGTYMQAPNGKKSKLSPRQWVQVRTKAFKEWFGDWELGHKVLNVVSASKEHGFKNFDDAKAWAKENIVRTLKNEETGNKGEIRISNTAVAKFLSESAVAKSDGKNVHLSVLKVLPDVIRESIDAEQHPDYKKGSDGKRSAENGVNENVTIHRLYGAVDIDGKTYRVKVTLKEDVRNKVLAKKAYSYEATKIELLAGTLGKPNGDAPSTNNSISAAKLLENVESSKENVESYKGKVERSKGNGKNLLDCSKVVDENGEPLVVYHGTLAKELTKFDPEMVGSRYSYDEKGFFFTSSENIAHDYASSEFDSSRKGKVIDTFISLRNPLIVDSKWCLKNGLGRNVFKDNDAIEFWDNYQSLLLEESEGKDGIIIDDGTTKMVVSFEPTQIKSATENVGTFSSKNTDIRYHRAVGEEIAGEKESVETSIEATNKRFNEELSGLTEENKDRTILSLGRPSAVLLSAGVENKPMKLYGNKVIKKMKKHGFSLDELRNLPAAVADPIAVFDNYHLDGNRTILTELQSNGNNIMVAVTLGKDGVDVDFNIVSSVFGKGEDNIVDWINKGYSKYINKEKALAFLSHPSAPIAAAAANEELKAKALDNLHHSDRSISEALSNPRLVSAAKVVEDFENPKIAGTENSNFASRYETKDGKTVNYTSENPEGYGVSETKDGTTDSGTGPDGVQRQGDNQLNLRDSRLDEDAGEFCVVERVFTENGSFNFTSGEKIESADDVAFIFSALEDAAKEHSFIVYVKDGRPTVVELGMGTFTGTMVDIPTASLAYSRIRPDQVYFVHNHPSGNLKCSMQDVKMLQQVEDMFDVPVHGVIINLKTGKYGTFDTSYNTGIGNKRIPDTASRLTVHTLDKQIFAPDYDPMAQPLVRSSEDVAQFLNSHRMGDRAKVSFLILSRAGRIVGNIHTPFTEISSNPKEVARYISERVIQFGGESAILYGDFPMSGSHGDTYQRLKKMLSQVGGNSLLDVVRVEGNHTTSAKDEGLLYEPGSEYGASQDVRYRFIGKEGASRLDRAEEATTRMDNLGVARQMEVAFNEKKERIEKLRKSEPVRITGDEIEPSDDLKQYRKNALEFGKKLQGSYTNKDTGRSIQLQRGRKNGGLKEVLQHDGSNKAHIQSVAAIPQIIENAIYIDSAENRNTSKNPNVTRYHYYVCGLKIGENDYTVRMVEAEEKDGSRYYDHKLTAMEKGKLMEELANLNFSSPPELSSTPGSEAANQNRPTDGGETQRASVSVYKDRRLLSLLQTNERENAPVPQTSAEAKSSHAEKLAKKFNTPIQVVTDTKELTNGNAEQQALMRRSKGFYYPATGKVVVVIPNNANVEDVAATVFHEVVAHKGLRELIGAENYDAFCDEIYAHLKDDLKRQVDVYATHGFMKDPGKGYEHHRRVAVDELLGRMAEKGFEDFTKAERGIWTKLKAKVLEAINKFLGSLKLPKWVKLGDNELRYMLWRSKERLERGTEHPIDLARDIVKREELGLTDEARYNMGDAPETFKARQRRAVENRGTVMPGLNDAQVKVVDVPKHSYSGSIKEATQQATETAKAKYAPNGKQKTLHYNNFGAEFDYSISGSAVEESLNPKQQAKSVNKGVHLAMAEHLDEIIGQSIEVEEHPDYLKNEQGERDTNIVNDKALMHRFYGAVVVDGVPYRVMTLMREEKNPVVGNGIHAYEVQKIEVLDEGTPNTSNGVGSHPQSEIGSSYPLAKLLQKVEKSYDKGKKLLEESKIADESTDLYRDPDETEDIWKREELGLTDEARYNMGEEANSFHTVINEMFDNADFDKAAHQRERYDLGKTPVWMKRIGITGDRFSLSFKNIKEHTGKDADHDLTREEWHQLPDALRNPFAVTRYNDANDRFRLYINIMHNGHYVAVGVDVKRVNQGRHLPMLEVNSIKTVFAHHGEIGGGERLITYDKEITPEQEALLRGLNFREYPTIQELSAAKVIEDFENPKIAGENNDGGDSEHLLFRDGDFTPRDRRLATDQYERMLARGSWQFREATQDSMLGLKTLYESILGRKTRIENVAGYENAYLYENRMSSANNGEQHQYFIRYMKPLLKAIYKLCGSNELDRRILTDYMMAKHGLERNAHMRNEAAKHGEYTKRDFAGLCGLTGESDWQTAETVAQQMVDDYEKDHDTTELWYRVKQATHATLEKIYLSGLISNEVYNNVLGMYDYYIPLRGWEETTSDEVYGYLTSKDGPLLGGVFKRAKGRKSKADDPVATIAMMADDAIRQGNRNIMKQRFLNFVHGHPSDLVSVNEMWLHHNDVRDEWEPVFANLEPNMTHEEVENEIARFEARMEALKNAEPDKYKRGIDARNIPYKVVRGNLDEHQVLVKRNGRTYVLTINGNPRAAQALNGLTNPDVEIGGVVGNLLKAGEYVNRQFSAFYTTRNPDFVVSNFIRDTLYSNCMTWVRESPRYALRFHKNFGRVNPVTLRILLSKWENDTLSDRHYLEKMFMDFMLNGGETGYTSLKDIEGHKRTIAAELKKQGSLGRQAWSELVLQLDLLNRSVENCARFAAFLTSREMGRTLDRSIYDAKEVSVNFNKKGSGGKFVNANGQRFLGKVGSYIGGVGRIAYVFWNAGIQGMTNFGRASKRHPVKALLGAAAMFTLGQVVPLLAQMCGGGDDDDKNAYYNLPEYVRRSNICIKAGDQWITIALPVECRAIYGLGELSYSVMSGNERYSDSELACELAAQVSQLMPLDMLEGGGGVAPFIPSIFKPGVEAYALNRSWMGLPVYKDSPYNENDPEWTKAYQSADQHLVAFSRWLNQISGGNDYKKGAIDINPAKIEYVLESTFGGVSSTIGKMKKMTETFFGDREFEWRNMLLVNRVVKSGDERTANRKLRNEYFKYKDEYEETGRLMRKYNDAKDNGIVEYAAYINFLENSDEYLRYEIFGDFKDDLDAYFEEIASETDESEKVMIEAEMYGAMRQMVNALHDPATYFQGLYDAGKLNEDYVRYLKEHHRIVLTTDK